MKVFCSYAFTGEEIEMVEKRMRHIVDTLRALGHDAYCNRFDPDVQDFTEVKQFITDALNKLSQYDTVYVINTSERRSEGMLIEVGAALSARKRVVFAQHNTSIGRTYLNELADETFVWSSEDELLQKTKEIFAADDNA